MKSLTILVLLMLVIKAEGQLITVLDSVSHIRAEIPKKYKIYTYSEYSENDSSFTISTTRDKFDLIIREPKNEKNYIITLPQIKNRIKGKESYNLKTGESAIFTVIPDKNCILEANKAIALELMIDENGSILSTSPTPLTKRFDLSGLKIYCFRYTPLLPGTDDLQVKILQDTTKIESKIFPLQIRPNKINIHADTKISEYDFEKIINYRIISSIPVLSALDITLVLNVKVNNINEKIEVKNILFQKGTKVCSGIIKRTFPGRIPRNFSVTEAQIRINSEQHNAIYITE